MKLLFKLSVQHKYGLLPKCHHSISQDCPLFWRAPVMKFIINTNGTITALSNESGNITCIDVVWPITNHEINTVLVIILPSILTA